MGSLKNAESLFTLTRGGIDEISVHGWGYFFDGQDIYLTQKDIGHEKLILRSLLKPWQALATGVSLKSRPHWALCVASHSGEPQHVDAAKQLIKELEVSIAEIICPPSYPMDPKQSCRCQIQGQSPSVFYHPCIGKHALIWASCRMHGWPTSTYHEQNHPYHAALHEFFSQRDVEVKWVSDSCGLWSAVISFVDFHKVVSDFLQNQDAPVVQVKNLMTQYPQLIGGTTRLDSKIMELGQGSLIAKEGADGLLFVGELTAPYASVIVKLASGYDIRYLYLALFSILQRQEHKLVGPWRTLYQYLDENKSTVISAGHNLQV